MKPRVIPNQFDDADEACAENQYLEEAMKREVIPLHDNRPNLPPYRSCGSIGKSTKDSSSIVSADSIQDNQLFDVKDVKSKAVISRVYNAFLSHHSTLKNRTISVKVGNSSVSDDSSVESDEMTNALGPSFSVPPGVTEDDVLCGRGKGANNFIGNRRFRAIVMRYRDIYSKCTRRSDKRVICHRIVDAVHSRGGKFLTKDTKNVIENPLMEGWTVLDEEKVIVKVSQALREGVAKWNKATQRHEEAKAKQIALLSTTPAMSLLAEISSSRANLRK